MFAISKEKTGFAPVLPLGSQLDDRERDDAGELESHATEAGVHAELGRSTGAGFGMRLDPQRLGRRLESQQLLTRGRESIELQGELQVHVDVDPPIADLVRDARDPRECVVDRVIERADGLGNDLGDRQRPDQLELPEELADLGNSGRELSQCVGRAGHQGADLVGHALVARHRHQAAGVLRVDCRRVSVGFGSGRHNPAQHHPALVSLVVEVQRVVAVLDRRAGRAGQGADAWQVHVKSCCPWSPGWFLEGGPGRSPLPCQPAGQSSNRGGRGARGRGRYPPSAQRRCASPAPSSG